MSSISAPFFKKRLEKKIEELTARKKFTTNKEKRPICFTQKSHLIKLFRSRKQGYFVKIKKGWHRSISFTQKRLDKMLEKKKAKKSKRKKKRSSFLLKRHIRKNNSGAEKQENLSKLKNRRHRCFSFTRK